MANTGLSPAIREIAAWIWAQNWIQSGSQLPSAHAIAKAHNSSLRQTLRALHFLEELGFVDIGHGGSINPRGNASSLGKGIVPAPRIGSVQSTTEKILDGIAGGIFRSGEALPKSAWLCREWHLSTRVLAQACRLLETKEALRKEGKSWIVGPAFRTSSRKSRHASAILIVCNRPEDWASFHGNLLDPMASAIEAEANRLGVRLIPVLTGSMEVPQVFPCGKDAIRRTMQELGDSLQGILLTPLLEELPSLDDWAVWLTRFGKPVVWMQDYYPERPLPAAAKVHRVTYGAWVGDGRMTETECALQALRDQGHRNVAFLCNDPAITYWFGLRADKLESDARRMGMEILRLERVCSDIELLQTALAGKSVSALLAPNDHYAVRYWRALAELGLRVPKDISMVSFDNLAALRPYPISTVDFGMATLGYQIFHVLLGDVPIRVHKGRRLMGECRLVDNGSIGEVRRLDSSRRKAYTLPENFVQ